MGASRQGGTEDLRHQLRLSLKREEFLQEGFGFSERTLGVPPQTHSQSRTQRGSADASRGGFYLRKNEIQQHSTRGNRARERWRQRIEESVKQGSRIHFSKRAPRRGLLRGGEADSFTFQEKKKALWQRRMRARHGRDCSRSTESQTPILISRCISR